MPAHPHAAAARTARLALLALVLLWLALAPGPSRAAEGDPPAFSTGALNTGLAAPPADLDRSTPRAALEGLYEAVRAGRLERAAHVLDLSAIPQEDQAIRGPILATHLVDILERRVFVDWDRIPDRPDGMETTGTDRTPMVGEPRKSMSLASLETERWPVAVRINRVKPETGDPVWVISPQTVEAIPRLHDLFGPTAFEKALPDELRTPAIGSVEVWELLVLPVFAGLAFLAGWLVNWLMRRGGALLPWNAASLALRRAALPVALAVTLLLVNALTAGFFVFSQPVDAVLSPLLMVLFVLAVVIAVSRALDAVIDFASNRYIQALDDPANTRSRHLYTNLSAVKRVGVILALVVGVAIAIFSLDVFSTFGMSLLVSAGVAAAVFSIAAQTLLGNLFASLQIAFAKPIRIGDSVYFDDRWAYVERINYTFVQLRTWDERRYVVPVRYFVSTAFENWTREDPTMVRTVVLTLDHRANVARLRGFFGEIAPQDPDWKAGAEPKVMVVGQDEEGMQVRFYCTATDPTRAWNLHCRLREEILAFIARDDPGALPRTRLLEAGERGGAASGARRRPDAA